MTSGVHIDVSLVNLTLTRYTNIYFYFVFHLSSKILRGFIFVNTKICISRILVILFRKFSSFAKINPCKNFILTKMYPNKVSPAATWDPYNMCYICALFFTYKHKNVVKHRTWVYRARRFKSNQFFTFI